MPQDRETDDHVEGGVAGATPGEQTRREVARRLAPAPGSDPVLNGLADLAMALLRTTAAQVSVLTEVQTVTAGAGLADSSVGEQASLAEALCTLTAIVDGPMVVHDATTDERVRDRDPVTAGVVGSYLGVPLSARSGHIIGALCVFEPMPRAWTDTDVALLSRLAELAVADLQASVQAEEDDARRLLGELATSAAGVGAFDWDLTTGRLAWDDRLVELFDYHRGEFEESIEDFNARIHPDDLTDVSRRLQTAIDTCGDFEATYRVVVPDAATRWVSARGRALRDETGETTRLLGAAWDVTATREESDRIAGIVENLAVGYFAVDTDWRITHVNAAFERIAGMDRADVLGRSYWEVFPAAVGTAFETTYRHTMSTGESRTFDAYYPQPIDVWVEVRVERIPTGMAVYFLDITARRRLQDDAEAAARRARLLGRITEDLAADLDVEEAAQSLASMVVPALADWAVVTLVEDQHAPGRRRGLRAAGAKHTDPDLQAVVETYARTRMNALTDDAIIVRVMETGTPQFLTTGATNTMLPMLQPGPVTDLVQVLAPAHVALYPLTGRSGAVGILSLCNGAARGPFTEQDLMTAAHVAARAGVVLDNARLYRQQRDLAEGLQRSLLTEPPEPNHSQIVVRYTPAAEAAQVGGDWYDAFLQPAGATMVVIGDVVGHDTQAAAAMSQVRTLLRGIGASDGMGPAQVLRKVDQVMETLRIVTTATAVLARFEQDASGERRGTTLMRWSNAGHPPPMVINPDGSVLALSPVSSDLLLGVMPTTSRHESTVTLDRGATVLLYTDGLVERRGQSLEEGLMRLQELLTELAPDDLRLDDLVDAVLSRLLPPRPEDDVALIAVRLHPQNEPRPAEAGLNRIPPNVPVPPTVIDQPC